MAIERNNVIFLLGAGCSRDAGILVSGEMVTDVQKLILDDPGWQPFRELYYYLRSCIQFSEGIFGNFDASFNIEKLLIVINDLEKKEKNAIFPFIGAWDNRLLELTGPNFEQLKNLKEKIKFHLVNNWVKLSDYRDASYYSGFNNLQFGESGLGLNLKIFSLNYDLCFEKVVGKENIELGFDDYTGEWSYNNFERADEKSFTLYKLHGSLDWYSDQKTKKLKQSADAHSDPLLIFGENNKLRAIDPYLFYIYEFRRYCFNKDLKLIVCIGYSFSDDHINDIISQAIRNNEEAKILTITRDDQPEKKLAIINALGLTGEYTDRVVFEVTNAKKFLETQLTTSYLSSKIITSEELPFTNS